MTSAPRIELDSRSPEAIDGRHIRAITFQDIRLEYLASVMKNLDLAGAGSRALVVGSGRGMLAGALARLGYEVVAVDPSQTATAMASEAEDGTGVVHETAAAEELPFPDASFDLAYYADTFEITADLDRVIAHAARLLKPGGTLVYDTVNRTPLSRLVYLGAFQALPMTRIVPPGRYAAARLRTPAELAAALGRNGLHNEDVCGFKPKDPRNLIKATLARRRGQITDEEIAPIVDFVLTPQGRPLVTYLGYARKL